MKNYIKYIMAFTLAFITSQSFADNYNPNDSFEVAKNKLKQTDCSVSLQECRYYAAIEYVAFAKACGIAFAYKTKGTDEDIKTFDIMVNEWIENWKAIEEPQLHAAVLSSKNPFKEKMTKEVTEYLKNSPIDDVGIECSRIGSIKEQQVPEETSDLLQSTVSFDKWYAPIMRKKGMVYMDKNGKITQP